MTSRLSPDEVRSRVKALPGLPKVVHELSRALRSEDTASERIVRLVSSDAALTAMALKLANSSFYGARGRVLSLRDAVQILGMQTLSATVTTAAVMSCLSPTACTGHDAEAAWRHALGTALTAQLLAESRGLDACTAYTVGLLHDIGGLALATCFPESYSAVLAWSVQHDVPVLDVERELLGTDHAEVGALISEHWHFAPLVTEAIRTHHAVPEEGGDTLLDLLHLADNITHALDIGHAADDRVPPLSLGAWGRIHPTAEELQDVFERIEARVQDLDLGLYR